MAKAVSTDSARLTPAILLRRKIRTAGPNLGSRRPVVGWPTEHTEHTGFPIRITTKHTEYTKAAESHGMPFIPRPRLKNRSTPWGRDALVAVPSFADFPLH
jgi:hypothetical protein